MGFVLVSLFKALPGTGLAQGEKPTAQTADFQFHTSSSAGVGL
jgi:hypothetical protein